LITIGRTCDDFSNLELDKDEAEALKLAKIMEEEKAQFSVRNKYPDVAFLCVMFGTLVQ
jgi:hypothetical protein